MHVAAILKNYVGDMGEVVRWGGEEFITCLKDCTLDEAVELAELWRNDKAPRRLEAMMIVADKDNMFVISGSGDVIEPDGGVCAIGSGGNYALAAARALYQETDYDAPTVAEKALRIASDICIFTNGNITVEEV